PHIHDRLGPDDCRIGQLDLVPQKVKWVSGVQRKEKLPCILWKIQGGEPVLFCVLVPCWRPVADGVLVVGLAAFFLIRTLVIFIRTLTIFIRTLAIPFMGTFPTPNCSFWQL